MSKTNSTVIAGLAAAALVASPALLAQGAQGGAPYGQQGAPQSQPPGAGGAQDAVDDAMLDRFASAYIEIEQIRKDYSGRLQQAKDQEQATELQREAQQEMLEVVRDNDLSVQDYNQVATAMTQQPKVRERVAEKIEEKR